MFTKTGIAIAECSKDSSNICGYCEMLGEITKADFISETKFFYTNEEYSGPHYSHESVCAKHIVALIENYRDIDRP